MTLTPEQQALRNEKIGGSDAAVACGLSEYMTARALYHVFRGEMEREPIDPMDAYVGHMLEGPICQRYTEETSRKLRNIRETRHSKKYPWAIAHIDRDIVGVREGFDAKTARSTEAWGESGSDEVPDDVYMQAVHYMAVYDYEAWIIGVFFLIQKEFRWYRIERDLEIETQLMKAERYFMDCVAQGVPPEWDYNHPTTLALLKKVYPGTNGMSVDLDASIITWWDVYEDALAHRARYDAVIMGARNHILAAMELNAIGNLPDGSNIVQKRIGPHGSVRLDRRVPRYM